LAFSGLRNVSVIYLKANKLMGLDPLVFKPLSDLREIWLQDNLLTILDGKLFANNVKLDKIYLNNNWIVALEPGIFQHLYMTSILDLSNNSCVNKNMTGNDDLILEDCYVSYKYLNETRFNVSQGGNCLPPLYWLTAITALFTIILILICCIGCKKKDEMAWATK
jgi:hypothetical protein